MVHEEFHLNNTDLMCMQEMPKTSKIINKSDEIITGTVIDIDYYDCNGIPWSCLYVKVDDVLYGSKKVNDIVKVFVMEGYEYVEGNGQMLTEYQGDDFSMHQIGDTSVFMLQKEEETSIFGKDAYLRTFSCFAEFRYDEEKKGYLGYTAETYGGNAFMEKKEIAHSVEQYIE